jgi:hypothetical protein
MKRFFIGTALLVATFVSTAADTPEVIIDFGFLRGNSYRQLSEVMRRGYVMGIVDGFYYSPMFGAPEKEVDRLSKCLTGWSDTQVMAVVDKWLANKPARWHEPMHVLTHTALADACP